MFEVNGNNFLEMSSHRKGCTWMRGGFLVDFTYLAFFSDNFCFTLQLFVVCLIFFNSFRSLSTEG